MKLKGSDGITLAEPLQAPYVLIDSRVFDKPQSLDETLLHEFVHVCENLFFAELAKPAPDDCSNYAIVLGKYLTQMLRDLRQVAR